MMSADTLPALKIVDNAGSLARYNRNTNLFAPQNRSNRPGSDTLRSQNMQSAQIHRQTHQTPLAGHVYQTA